MSTQAVVNDAIGAPVFTHPLTYFGSKLSENITRTPEGYLICRNVPIARTGWQDYTADEIGADGGSGRKVRVYRSPEEVFAPEAIASGEGKPVTEMHPPVFLNPQNYGGYLRGHAQNLRPSNLRDGEGERLLLADLIVMDASLINRVENGLREISVGYGCDYEPIRANDYAQKNIRINHVAIVINARAGNDVRIYDSKPETNIKEQDMATESAAPANPVQEGIGAIQAVVNFMKTLGFKSPQEVRDAESEAVKRNEESAEKSEERNMRTNEKDDDDDRRYARDDDDDWKRRVTDLEGKLGKLEGEGAGEPEEEEEEGEEHEESKDDDTYDDHDLVPVETLSKEDRPKNPIPGAPQTVDALRQLRPLIAKHGTTDDRKAFNRAMLTAKGIKLNARDSRVYGSMTRTVKPAAVATAEAMSGVIANDSGKIKAEREAGEFVNMAKQYHKKNPGEVVLQMPALGQKKEA